MQMALWQTLWSLAGVVAGAASASHAVSGQWHCVRCQSLAQTRVAASLSRPRCETACPLPTPVATTMMLLLLLALLVTALLLPSASVMATAAVNVSLGVLIPLSITDPLLTSTVLSDVHFHAAECECAQAGWLTGCVWLQRAARPFVLVPIWPSRTAFSVLQTSASPFTTRGKTARFHLLSRYVTMYDPNPTPPPPTP